MATSAAEFPEDAGLANWLCLYWLLPRGAYL